VAGLAHFTGDSGSPGEQAEVSNAIERIGHFIFESSCAPSW
jgi:hypothetical protein